MKLQKNFIFSILFALLALTNILTLLNVNYFFISDIISLVALFVVPGSILFLLFKIKKMSFWEIFCIIPGLSLTFIMFVGLFINFLFPFVGIKHPLSLYPVLFGFDNFLLILGAVAYAKNKGISFSIPSFQFKWKEVLLYLLPLFFLPISILGSINLNNGHSNILTMILIGGIGLYVLLLTILNKRISSSLFPYSLYFMSLSIIFTTSLRGWSITGHDIQTEYYVFQLTKDHFYWNMAFFQNAYNACLSITLLPTILSNFFHANDIYIYKIIYQVLFAIVPVSTFLLFKKYVSRQIAFISAFHFILFPTFVNDMSMLNRQEIAFVFFSLMLLILPNKQINSMTKKILFLLFGTSMVLSHYSTTYMSLGTFLLGYVILFILKSHFFQLIFNKLILRMKRIKFAQLKTSGYSLNLPILISLLLFTFSWIALTGTGSNLSDLATKTLDAFKKHSKVENKSEDTLYSIFDWHKKDESEVLKDYVDSNKAVMQESKDKTNFYDEKVSDKYPITNLSEEVLPLTGLGKVVTSFHVNVFSLIDFLRQGYAKLIQIFVILGIISFFLYKKNEDRIDIDYISLSISGVIVLFLQVLLPTVSAEYGVLRAFQQMLMLLALPVTLGCISFFGIFSKKYSVYITTILFIFFFFILMGGSQQVLGGYNPVLRLNNDGLYYDAYYMHTAELSSMDWLAKNRNNSYPIQTNKFAGSKFMANEEIVPATGLLPSTIYKNGYVYLDYMNVTKQRDIVFYKGDLLIYRYPTKFLDDNKNLVYNNNNSRIYK